MSGQSIRPSQFITTYGPGSLVETTEGPIVILDYAKSGLFQDPATGTPGLVANISDFEITDKRLSVSLLGGAGIFAIPTNEDLGFTSNAEVYRTLSFPAWSICVGKHGQGDVIYRMPRGGSGSGKQAGCPECIDERIRTKQAPMAWGEAWKKSRREATTFVRACIDGHLDDVPWPLAVAHASNCSNNESYWWIGSGSSLESIIIECRECGQQQTMRQIFTKQWPCMGRFPEMMGPGATCNRASTVLLKGAANLRQPEIVTALTIPPNDSPLHNILGRMAFQTVLKVVKPTSKQQIIQMVKLAPELAKPEQVDLLEASPEQEILTAIRDLDNQSNAMTTQEIKTEEFRKLVNAATHGAPQVLAKHHSLPPRFEVVRTDVKTFQRPKGHVIRVAPINRLRVVMVQTGYTRPVGDQRQQPTPVPRTYHDGTRAWFPGVELSGEGIFLDLLPADLQLSGQAAGEWQKQFTATGLVEHHPVFVWWHTYAHRVINALAVDSGYAAASIRERIFCAVDKKTGAAEGGVLLYTSQPGGDGTLGGLVALVPNFDAILRSAEAQADSCSNDPICEEQTYRAGKSKNGAACYACQFVSETSCDHRNTGIDRNLLRENMP